MLWMYRRVIFGPLDQVENQNLKDIGAREIALLTPILILIFLMGIYPSPWLNRIKPSVDLVVNRVVNNTELVHHAVKTTQITAEKETAGHGN
jgi:NADH-quinone oxidoreductase subunit M